MTRCRILLLFVCLPACWTAAGAALVTDITSLREAKAAKAIDTEFAIEGTITYNARVRGDRLTVQDGDQAISFWYHAPADPASIVPGDRVLVSGVIRHGQKSNKKLALDCTDITVLSHGALPEAKYVVPGELFQNDFGNILIRTEGTIIDIVPDEIDPNWMYFALSSQGIPVFAAMRTRVGIADCRHFIGNYVSVTGLSHGEKGRSHAIKAGITMDSTNSISVIRRQTIGDMFDAPSVDDLDIAVNPGIAGGLRRSSVGTVLATWNGNQVLVRTDTGTLVKGVMVGESLPEQGTRICMVGFPETDLYTIILVRAIWRNEPGPVATETAPEPMRATQLQRDVSGRKCFNIEFQGRTISLCGIVRSIPTANGDMRLYLECDGHLVAVDTAQCAEAVAGLEAGYKVEVCGICIMETERTGLNLVLPRINGVLIVPRRAADIRIVARPSWWTPAKFLSVIGTLFLGLIGFFVWNLSLKRIADRRSRALLKERLAHAESELRIGERTRLAVELHDTLSQNLTGAAMEISTAEELASDDREATRHHLALASKTLKSCRDELRACLWDLRSQALESGNMNDAIRKALEPYVHDVKLALRFNVPRARFTDNTAHALLRIIRELVTNAIRHGRATNVWVAGSREGGRLLFSVRDDGCGFDPDTAPGVLQGHFGLQGIRERLRLLNGRLSVESAPGSGTKITVCFELPTSTGDKV